MSLFDLQGKRKYLTPTERKAFIRAAERMPLDVRTFLLTLAFTGARISEVLALTPTHIDRADGVITIECLKSADMAYSVPCQFRRHCWMN